MSYQSLVRAHLKFTGKQKTSAFSSTAIIFMHQVNVTMTNKGYKSLSL